LRHNGSAHPSKTRRNGSAAQAPSGRYRMLLGSAQPVVGAPHREPSAVYVADPRQCGGSDEQDADARASSPSTHPNIRFRTISECPTASRLSTVPIGSYVRLFNGTTTSRPSGVVTVRARAFGGGAGWKST
jgi:hypothetical protein